MACGGDEAPEWHCVETPARPAGTVIAGSGATLPLAHKLVELYQSRYPDRPVHLAQSIGTGGALRALADGAIDIGLASRGLEDEPVSAFMLLGAPIRLAAHPQAPDAAISWEFLIAAAEGNAHWSDGTPAVFIHREPGDSGTRAVTAGAPELSAAIDRGRDAALLVAYTDAEALRQLTSVPGAIGLYDPIATRLGEHEVRELLLEESPNWRRPLSVFWEGDAPHFVEFLSSPEVAALLEALREEADAR